MKFEANGVTVKPSYSQMELAGHNFDRQDLRGIRFTDANLAGATFRYAQLDGACFERSNLTGADFTGASMIGTLWGGADLTDTMPENDVGIDYATILKELSRMKNGVNKYKQWLDEFRMSRAHTSLSARVEGFAKKCRCLDYDLREAGDEAAYVYTDVADYVQKRKLDVGRKRGAK